MNIHIFNLYITIIKLRIIYSSYDILNFIYLINMALKIIFYFLILYYVKFQILLLNSKFCLPK